MHYLNIGFQLLKKIINTIFDNDGFPKSRNPRQVIFYLKYLVLINNDVEVLATYKEEVVAVRQGKHIGISCHPELLNETLIHEICFKGKHEVS